MNTEMILSTLLAAAAFLKHAARDVATQAVADAYGSLKNYLKTKLCPDREADSALELATAKPESLLRKAVLAEACADHALEDDDALKKLVEKLAALLPTNAALPVSQTVAVSGRGNSVQVAGRDLIHTAKIVRRNTITPDERHVTFEQREQLRDLIREVAERLVADDGEANFAAVHRQLQRRFEVASYLLLPRQLFDDALAFLKQLRAANRTRLRQQNSRAYCRDLYRAIFAGARELSWNADRVHAFATEKLRLTSAVQSLKELGPIQLKTLADLVRGEVRAQRRNRVLADAPLV